MKKMHLIAAALLIAGLILSACSGAAPAAPADTGPVQTAAVQTFVAAQQPAAKLCDLAYGGLSFNQEAGTTKTWTKADGTSFTVTLESGSCNILNIQDPASGQPDAQNAPSTPTANAVSGAQGTDYQGAEGCQDGKIVSNQYADITRIPIGTLEGAIVAEISWTGSGFGGFDRAIVVIPRMTAEKMAFVRNSRTIHLVQYCGFLKDILAWAPTHVDAMVQSAQDDAGNRPDPAEIGVYFLNLDGQWTVVREGPKGPGLAFVQQRVVMTP